MSTTRKFKKFIKIEACVSLQNILLLFDLLEGNIYYILIKYELLYSCNKN